MKIKFISKNCRQNKLAWVANFNDIAAAYTRRLGDIIIDVF